MPLYFRTVGILIFLISNLFACQKEDLSLGKTVVEGTVLGPGCRTGSFAIQVKGKNRQYGIRESADFDNIIETFTLPEAFQTSGTRIFFRFNTLNNDETSQYLTYCTPPPQIIIVAAASSRQKLSSSLAE